MSGSTSQELLRPARRKPGQNAPVASDENVEIGVVSR